jgi:hypothetical protein
MEGFATGMCDKQSSVQAALGSARSQQDLCVRPRLVSVLCVVLRAVASQSSVLLYGLFPVCWRQ